MELHNLSELEALEQTPKIKWNQWINQQPFIITLQQQQNANPI